MEYNFQGSYCPSYSQLAVIPWYLKTKPFKSRLKTALNKCSPSGGRSFPDTVSGLYTLFVFTTFMMREARVCFDQINALNSFIVSGAYCMSSPLLNFITSVVSLLLSYTIVSLYQIEIAPCKDVVLIQIVVQSVGAKGEALEFESRAPTTHKHENRVPSPSPRAIALTASAVSSRSLHALLNFITVHNHQLL